MRKLTIPMAAAILVFLGSMPVFSAETSIWKANNAQNTKDIWASDGTTVESGSDGLRMSFSGGGWQGVVIPAWGQLKDQAAVRLKLGRVANAKQLRATVRVKSGDDKDSAKQGPVLKIRDYPAATVQGGEHLLVEVARAVRSATFRL